MQAKRRSLSHDDRAAAGEAVARIACALPEFGRAERVAAYVALDDEVPTHAILDAVLASGRVLLLPRLAAKQLEFAAVADLASLCRGGFGVFEPSLRRWRSSSPRMISSSCQVWPSIDAADASTRRRSLRSRVTSATRAPVLLGVAFSFQLVDVVPAGPFDRRVDGIVTEVGIVRVPTPPRDPTRDSG
jgi:5-formyltetrahydrofolate cyclo-ligase